MSFAEITIPASWDIPFLLRHGTSFDYSVSSETNGTVRLQVHSWDLEKLTAAVTAYPTEYLTVCLSPKLAAISAERDRRIQSFTFGGQVIPLDDQTKLNLDCAALGLMRNTGVLAIAWSLGNGEFVTLPREVILGMADAAFMHTQGLFSRHQALAKAAKDAKTIDELKAIDETADASWVG